MTSALIPSTAIRPPWLYLARAAWSLLAVASISLFVISTLETLRTPLPSCAAPGAQCPSSIQLTVEDAELALDLGLPLPLLPLSLAFSVAARLSLAVVGLVIFWRRSDDWVAMIMSGALMTVLLEGAQGLDPSQNLLHALLFGIGTTLFLPIPFIFPSGAIQPRWLRWPVIALTAAYAAVVVFLYSTQYYAQFSAILSIAWVALAAMAMPYRYFRVSNPVERQQTKWVLLGMAAVLFVGSYYSSVTALHPPSAPSHLRVTLLLINVPLYVACYGFFAISILVAMLRYRLWDIDLVIRRTLVYSSLSALLALTYFGSVVVTQSVMRAVTGQAQSQLVTVLSTLAIAALFFPLRARVQDFIDRRFFRRKYDAQKVLEAFAATARDETDLDRLTARLTEVVGETMQPDSISLWLKTTNDSFGRQTTAPSVVTRVPGAPKGRSGGRLSSIKES